jgi:hypothetical protein
MNIQKPIMEQLPEMKLPDTQALQATASNTMNSVNNTVANVQSSLTNTLNEFQSKTVLGASQEFANSNSIIAKFVFIILVLIVFMFLFNLGLSLMGYFMKPPLSPYLINGMVNGNNGIIIPQDPKNASAVQITRSNNQSTGIEFTWSVWLLITGTNSGNSGNSGNAVQHIFNKGDANYDTATGLSLINGPGVYLAKSVSSNSNANVLRVVMDKVDGSNQTMDISGVPMNKWFHLALRMENKILDAYVNGTIYSRAQLTAVPKQNYYNVNVGQNGGFQGSISNLRYFNYALPAYDINSIVATGANTASSSLSLQNSSTAAASLSNLWYSQTK